MRDKKIISILCAALIALTAASGELPRLMSGSAFISAEEATIGTSGETQESSFTYKENSTGITITGYTGAGGDVTIPSKIDGKKVTEIGWQAFWIDRSLTSVTIPDSVTVIDGCAFGYCESLTSVTIPNSVTVIGDFAFSDCTSLTSITLPDGVTHIGSYAFYGCTSLTSVTIPDNVIAILDHAFYGCTSLTSVTIPDNVITIWDHAFYGCTSLTSITIPDGVTIIDWYTFGNCTSLTSVTIPDGVTKIDDQVFNLCTSLTSVTIPDSVTRIGDNAFGGCTNLTIYGYTGSTAETYADENNIPFVALSFAAPQNVRIDENNCLIWDETDGADSYEVLLAGDAAVIKCETNLCEIGSLKDGSYTVRVRAVKKNGSVSNDSEPFSFTKRGESSFGEENKITEPIPDPPAPIPEEDRITSITINPAFHMKNKNDKNVELDLTKIKIKAQEIYDEAGLKRAEEALGEKIIGNKHYNLLDLTLLYDGKDFSNGYKGLVQVVIPLPTGHRDKTFSCYRLIEVDGKTTKEVIPGEQTEDSYIIYLEHFSEYALVADGGEEPHTHSFSAEWKSDSASHWHECACGEKSDLSAHTENSGVITTAPTTEATGVKTYSCTVCGYVTKTETVDKLEPEHTHTFSAEWKSDSASHWHECACGEKSELSAHTENSGVITTAPTTEATGVKTYSCTVCGYVTKTETVDKLEPDHTHTFSAEWKSDGASHWHECACGEKSELSAHTLGEWIANAAAGYRHRDCTVCGAVLETVSLSGGNPSVGRPSVNPAPSAGTAGSNNSDNANDPKDEEEPEPSEADEEEPEPSEADGEDDVDEIGGESDDDADEFDDDVDEDSDDSAEDDSYGDTASKDDTQAASNEVSAADMIARDENPSTGAGFGGTVFVFLGAGAAALAASKKGRKRADR